MPDDLAVVGVDNIPEAAYFHPPLTSVEQHLFDLGRTGVRMLVERIDAIENNEALESLETATWLRPGLVIRESSGAVPGKEA